jgi:hypothetical protein
MQYQLRAGDNLQALARANHTTVERIIQDNPQLASGYAHVGDTIHISVGSAPTNRPDLVEYPIQPGDTLASIAEHFMHDPNRAGELRAMNEGILDEMRAGGQLEAGDRLLVPAAYPAYQPQPQPQPQPATAQPAQPQPAQVQPQPQPATAAPLELDNRGITAQGPQVVAEQQQANAWLQTPAGQQWAAGPGRNIVGGPGQLLKVDGLEGPHTRAVVQAMRGGAVPAAATPAAATPPQVVAAEQQVANMWLKSPAGQQWAQTQHGQAAVGATGGQLPVNGQLDGKTLAVMHAMVRAEQVELNPQAAEQHAPKPAANAGANGPAPATVTPAAPVPPPPPPPPPVPAAKLPPAPVPPAPPPVNAQPQPPYEPPKPNPLAVILPIAAAVTAGIIIGSRDDDRHYHHHHYDQMDDWQRQQYFQQLQAQRQGYYGPPPQPYGQPHGMYLPQQQVYSPSNGMYLPRQ